MTRDGLIIEGSYSKLEFANIKQWLVTEKIDGTNIRIHWTVDQGIRFGGRTSEASIPKPLYKHLQDNFTQDTLSAAFLDEKHTEQPLHVQLFGEGYGAHLQKGGEKYRPDQGFILFGAWIDGWWLKYEDIVIIAEKLHIPVVPMWGMMKEEEIIELVKSKPLSRCSVAPFEVEGFVMQSYPLMLFRDGTPIMWKLKVKDYVKLAASLSAT